MAAWLPQVSAGAPSYQWGLLDETDGVVSTLIGPINDLREIALRCRRGKPLDEDLSQWLGDALQSFLSHDCRSIEEALGLKFAKGGIPWWREEANRARDAALRDLAEQFYDDLPPCAKARKIETIANRYAASAWRRHRHRGDMPRRYVGTSHELLWRAFKSGAIMPIGERQLRNILG